MSEWHMWFKQRGGRELRALLMEHWDPIEVRGTPEAFDEYDGYIGRIANRLRGGATVAEVAAILTSIRIRDMGLAPEPNTDTTAATTIVAWHAQAMRDEAKPGDEAR